MDKFLLSSQGHDFSSKIVNWMRNQRKSNKNLIIVNCIEAELYVQFVKCPLAAEEELIHLKHVKEIFRVHILTDMQ